MMNDECGMMNMKAGLSVLIHHSAFRIPFLSCSSYPSLLIDCSADEALVEFAHRAPSRTLNPARTKSGGPTVKTGVRPTA